MIDRRPEEVLDFWLNETPREKWFAEAPALDARIRSRFEALWHEARQGGLAHWEDEPHGALALIILLDQFPRNMFRGTADAFASDTIACDIAKRAIARRRDLEAPESVRSFYYLPLMHSESVHDQEDCVRLTRERLGDSHYSYPYAVSHREVVERFGRFPARNAVLGRETTREEDAFLETHPHGF